MSNRDNYIEAALRNLVQSQFVASKLSIELTKAVAKFDRSAAKLLLDPSLVNSWSSDRINSAIKSLETFLLEFGTIYMNAEGKNLAILTGVPAKVPIVTKKLINTALTTPMHTSNLSVMDSINRIKVGATQNVNGIVSRTLQEGLTVSQSRNELSAFLDTQKRHLDTIARSSINSTTNQMRQELYSANDDIVDRVVWNSVFDSRTSDICMGLSGKIFPIDKGARPPAHLNCRSFMVPIMKEENARTAIQQQLPKLAVEPGSNYKEGDTKTRTGRARKPLRSNDKLKRVETSSLTYESWIKKQPRSYQRDVLGKNAAEQLQEGVSLRKILKDRNNNLNLTRYKDILGDT